MTGREVVPADTRREREIVGSDYHEIVRSIDDLVMEILGLGR
jgi:hypothetical protein